MRSLDRIFRARAFLQQKIKKLSDAVRKLFSNGEQGVWYDPSDMSTMFRDAAGTTPVTAVEQPVGLMLDKSKGLVLGPELVDTANTAAAWAPFGSNTVTQIANGVVIQGVTDARYASLGLTQSGGLSVNLVVGKTYELSFSAFVNSAINAEFATMTATNAGAGSVTITTTPQNFTLRIVPRNEYSSFTLGSPSALLAITVTNISVRELPGNHATQTTSTSRPVLSARYNLLTKTEQFDDAVWEKVNQTVTANQATSPSGSLADLVVPTASGSGGRVVRHLGFGAVATRSGTNSGVFKAQGYKRVCLLVGDRGNGAAFVGYFDLEGEGVTRGIYYSTSGTATQQITSLGNGWYRCTMQVTSAGGDLTAAGFVVVPDNQPLTSGFPAAAADGVSGALVADADARVSNAGVGLPAYQRVNTSTDYDTVGFPHYLRFDGVDDWLVTPTITPGTDKAQVFAGVRKLSDATPMVFWEHGNNQAGGFTQGNYNGLGEILDRYNFWSRGSATLGFAWSGGYPAPTTNVLTGIGDISGDSAILRVNGTQAAISTADQGTGNYLDYPFYIGGRGGIMFPFNGHLYGLIVRFGANLPTQAITDTEKYVNDKTKAYV